MAVEVERDLDRGMAHESREGLGIDARRDHERGVGVARLVESQTLGQSSLLPSPIGAAIEADGVERPPAFVPEHERIVAGHYPTRCRPRRRSRKAPGTDVVRCDVRVLGAMDPSIGSHDSRTRIVPASRPSVPLGLSFITTGASPNPPLLLPLSPASSHISATNGPSPRLGVRSFVRSADPPGATTSAQATAGELADLPHPSAASSPVKGATAPDLEGVDGRRGGALIERVGGPACPPRQLVACTGMEDENPQLVLDEKLFLAAIKFLADLEGTEKPFELLNAAIVFAKEDYVATRFAADLGREIEAEEKRAIEYYVGAVYLVYHHRANLEDLDKILKDLSPSAAAFTRLAAWAFLTAWNFRYGGVWAERLSRGTLVDPRADS